MINPMLEAELLAHLDHQIALGAAPAARSCSSRARRSAARDSERVLAKLAEIQTRDGPPRPARAGAHAPAAERRRAARPARPAGHAGATLRPDQRPGARAARERSSELRGLLAEIAREHGINRALMRQELAFLSHLVRLVGDEPRGRLPARRRARRAGAARPRCTRPSTSAPDADLLLLRPPDVAARPARPAAGARHHGPQHRQRVDGGLLPPGGRDGRLAGARDPAGRRPGRRRRAHRLGRRRPVLPPHPRHVPRPPVPRAGDAPRRGGGPRTRASTAPSSRSPSRATTASTSSCRSSGAPGATSRTPPTTPPRAQRCSRRRTRSPRRSGSSTPSSSWSASRPRTSTPR